jgi:sialate O-acetylesterase
MKNRFLPLLMVLLLYAGFLHGVTANLYVAETSDTIKVACVGNSVTRGYGLVNPVKDSYPSQLQKLLGSVYQVGNFGHSGATLLSKGHRPYEQTPDYNQVLEFNADIIVIHLGLNDTDPRNWPNYRDEFVADYMRLIESFKQGSESTPQMFICRMTPIFNAHPRFKSGTRDWFWEIQEAIQQVADNTGARLIDLHTPLYSHPDLFKDALHPDEEGAGIIAQTVYESITGDFGGLQLASIFMNNMVLQQNRPIPVWGKANAGEIVNVTFQNQKRTTITGKNGNWKVSFDPVSAGGTFTLSVTTGDDQNITLQNVMVGEVWICAGQSNMEFRLKHAKNSTHLISDADDHNLRLLNKTGIVRPDDVAWDTVALNRINKLDFFGGEWKTDNPDDAAGFSAIGYSFGKILTETLNVPVGLIHISVGGAPIEAFIDRHTLELDPTLIDVLTNWKQNDFMMDWVRSRTVRNLANSNEKLQRHPFEPTYIYEAAISQLKGLPIAGVIWYQGESNAHNAGHYQNAFPALVQSWRKTFNQTDLPFYFAQLSSINRPSWPYFRDVQHKLTQTVPNTAMVVTSDLGDSLDVHPVRKIEVGQRFAYTALANVYNIGGIRAGSPEVNSVLHENGKLILTFSNAQSLTTSNDQPLRELEIAGKIGLFKPVSAQLNGNQIIVATPSDTITRVRYGWKPFSLGNLVNELGWPASTFEAECPFELNKKNDLP